MNWKDQLTDKTDNVLLRYIFPSNGLRASPAGHTTYTLPFKKSLPQHPFSQCPFCRNQEGILRCLAYLALITQAHHENRAGYECKASEVDLVANWRHPRGVCMCHAFVTHRAREWKKHRQNTPVLHVCTVDDSSTTARADLHARIAFIVRPQSKPNVFWVVSFFVGTPSKSLFLEAFGRQQLHPLCWWKQCEGFL